MKTCIDLTIVIISYKSEKKVFQLLKEFKNNFKCLIVDNSNSKPFKKKVEKSYNKIKVFVSNPICINFLKKLYLVFY